MIHTASCHQCFCWVSLLPQDKIPHALQWCIMLYWLMVSTPLKNIKVRWDDYSQYMGKCSKPPTSLSSYALVKHGKNARHVV